MIKIIGDVFGHYAKAKFFNNTLVMNCHIGIVIRIVTNIHYA